VASLVTLTYTGTHAAGALVNALLARYAPGVEAVVQAVEPVASEAALPAALRASQATLQAAVYASGPANAAPDAQAVPIYASVKAAQSAVQAA
jgi:hypothetical protein